MAVSLLIIAKFLRNKCIGPLFGLPEELVLVKVLEQSLLRSGSV